MRFREPSEVDRFFETPAHERPALDLDLPVSPRLDEVVRRIGSGVTRWVDLIIGFSMDDARRQGVEPPRIHDALEEGEIVLETFFFLKSSILSSDDSNRPPFGYDREARLFGTLAARSCLLSVSGGDPFGLPFSMEYQRQDDGAYVPKREAHPEIPFGNHRLHIRTSEFPESYSYDPEKPEAVGYYGVPDELRAASAFSIYADYVQSELDAGHMAVRSTITFIGQGQIRGLGRS